MKELKEKRLKSMKTLKTIDERNELKGNELQMKSTLNKSVSKFDKYVYTSLICFSNLTYGITLTCLSPALLDFTCILNTRAEIITHYFTLYAFGAIIGSLFGFLFKYINRQLTLTMTLFLLGLVHTSITFSPNIYIFYLFGFIGGMGSGSLDIVKTVWLIEMWGERSGSLLQLSEFMFGIGITSGPLLVRPFVWDEEECENPINKTTAQNQTINYSLILAPPFIASGLFLMFGAILFAIMYFVHKYIPANSLEENIISETVEQKTTKSNFPSVEETYQRRNTLEKTGKVNYAFKADSMRILNIKPRMSIPLNGCEKRCQSNGAEMSRRATRRFSTFHLGIQEEILIIRAKLPRKTIICLGAACFAFILVAETAYMDFSPTFFHFYANVEAPKAAILLSVMFASYTLTRAASIFVAIRVKPEYMLTVHYIIVLSSLGILYFANQSVIAIWVGNSLYGIGIATFWSATFSHIEAYFEVTDRICTIYVASMCMLQMCTQFIEGPFLEPHPEVLLYYCTGCISMSCICFLIIRVIVFRTNVKNKSNKRKINFNADIDDNNNEIEMSDKVMTKC